jgi:hypothetical protein
VSDLPAKRDWIDYLALGKALAEGTPEQQKVAAMLERVAQRYVTASDELGRLRGEEERRTRLFKLAAAVITNLDECAVCGELATKLAEDDIVPPRDLPACDLHGGSSPDLPYATQLRAFLAVVESDGEETGDRTSLIPPDTSRH